MRNFIRVLVGAALCSAFVACAAAPVPENPPAVAFGQAGLYRLEVALLVFYGCLLLITPAFSGLIRGRLPIEISARGAKFAEEAKESATFNEETIEGLKRATDDLAEGLKAANFEIRRLQSAPRRDNTKPAIGSRDD